MSVSFLFYLYVSIYALPNVVLNYFTFFLSLFFAHSCLFSRFCPLSFIFSLHLFPPLFVILFIPSLALSFLIPHSVYCLILLSSWHFFSKLFLWLLSFSSLLLHIFLLKYYIYVCIRTFTLRIFHSPAENKKWLMLIVWSYFIPFSWNALLLPILKHMYWVDWRIKYVENVPKFRCVLKEASCSGCTVNRAVVVFPLTEPEEDFKPLELKDLMAFFYISQFQGFF